MSSSTSPDQYCGVEDPTSVNSRPRVSVNLFWRTAASTPMPMPPTTAITMEAKTSSRVKGSLSAMSLETGPFVTKDVPMSPCTRFTM